MTEARRRTDLSLFPPDRLAVRESNLQSELRFLCFVLTFFLGLVARLHADLVGAFALGGLSPPRSTLCFGIDALVAAIRIFFGARINLCCEQHHYTSAQCDHRCTYFCFHVWHF